MDRYSIEKRDRELVERFRAKVELKEQQKKRNRMRLAAAVLVMVCVGMVFYYKSLPGPDLSPAPNGQTGGQMAGQMHRSTAVAVSRGPSKAPPTPEVASPAGAIPSEPFAVSEFSEEAVQTTAMVPAKWPRLSKHLAKRLSKHLAKRLAKHLAKHRLHPPGRKPRRNQTRQINRCLQKKALLRKEQRRPELPVFEPRASLSDKDGLSQKPAPVAPGGSIRIAGITVSQNVRNKQPVSRKTEVFHQTGRKAYVWMDVRSEKPPFELRHVYYLNDRRYCVVPLDIRYPRMRTWSTVSLEYPTQIGQWRVDVETREGEILSRVEFSVVPDLLLS
ncbi:MAG: DUF2914 domain-containing protein [Desulfobacterales bacterium]